MSSSLERVLEPEVMDTIEEVDEYDAMDHSAVNLRFAEDLLRVHGPARGEPWLDVGTGTARIPIAIARLDANVRIRAVDLAPKMIARARTVVDAEGFSDQITCECVDAKGLPYPDGAFTAVISNSIVHHIPEPIHVFREMARVLAPGGLLFVRDLFRPADAATLDDLVERYAGRDTARARGLFRDSLHAALTVEEVRDLLRSIGIPPESVSATSDRHWTVVWRRSEISE